MTEEDLTEALSELAETHLHGVEEVNRVTDECFEVTAENGSVFQVTINCIRRGPE